MIDFIIILFFFGILAASLQDLKRREVDNWLTLFLIFGGFIYLIFKFIFQTPIFKLPDFAFLLIFLFLILLTSFAFYYNSKGKENHKKYEYLQVAFWIILPIFLIYSFFELFGNNMHFFLLCSVSLLCLFALANIFYYGRVFAGGDAKLLFAMFSVFLFIGIAGTLANIGIFIFLLLVSGGIWGIFFGGFLFFKDFKKVKKDFKKQLKNIYFKYIFLIGVGLFFLSFFDFIFLFFSGMFFIFPVLMAAAKSIEKNSLIRELPYAKLREGDWIVNDIKIKGKTIRADWEGLTKEDLKILKGKKKIKIKEGIPFVPSFLIAFLLYVFAGNWILGFFNILY